MRTEPRPRGSTGSQDQCLPGVHGARGGVNAPLKNTKNPRTSPDAPAPPPRPSGVAALDLLAVAVIVVGHAQGLLLARLPQVLAELGPVQAVGLDLAVAAAQVLEGAASQAHPGLLKEAVAPAAEVPKLGKDEAGFPRD